MSLKQDFINYVENNFETNPLPENLIEYWNAFKSDSKSSNDKPLFTENGKKPAKPADPTRKGYVFGGWYYDSDFEEAYDMSFTQTTCTDFSLYAKWVPVDLAATLKLVGATSKYVFATEAGSPYIAPIPEAKAGYIFTGWYADEACTLPFDFETPAEEPGETVIYAGWKSEKEEETTVETTIETTTEEVTEEVTTNKSDVTTTDKNQGQGSSNTLVIVLAIVGVVVMVAVIVVIVIMKKKKSS